MNIKPLGDNVLVELIEREQVTKGGLVLPDNAKERPQEAKVLAVGSGLLVDGKRIPLEVKVGDTVIMSKYAGTEVKIDDVEYIIVRHSDILAIVE